MEHEVNPVCNLKMENLEKEVGKINNTIKDFPKMELLLEQQIASNVKQSEAMENQAKVLSEISLTLVNINGNQDRMSNELVKQGLEIEKIQAKDEQVKTRKMENWDKVKIAMITAICISFGFFILSKLPEYLVTLAK